MNASKEECHKANLELAECADKMDLLIPGDEDRNELKRHLLRVQNFLEVAERKLPTDQAFQKERDRRAKK